MKLKPLKIDTSQRDRYLELREGEYYFCNAHGSETELLGRHCKAFYADDAYFLRFDSGHFATKFTDVKIVEEEFVALRSGEISFDKLCKRYSKFA